VRNVSHANRSERSWSRAVARPSSAMEANPSTHLSPRCRSGQEDGREGCRRRVAGPAADVSEIRSLVRRHSSDAQAEQQASKTRERHQCWPDEPRTGARAPTRDRGRARRRRPRRSPPLKHHVAGVHGSRGRAETQTQRVGRPVNRDEREGRYRFDVLSVLSFIACASRHKEVLGAKPSGSTRDSPTRARSALVGSAASRTRALSLRHGGEWPDRCAARAPSRLDLSATRALTRATERLRLVRWPGAMPRVLAWCVALARPRRLVAEFAQCYTKADQPGECAAQALNYRECMTHAGEVRS